MTPRSVRHGVLFGAALSLALHLGVGLYVGGHEAPPLAFDFELPVDVEFGIGDEMMVAAGESESAAPEEQEVEATENEGGAGAGDAGVDGGMDGGPSPDAGPPDAGPEDAGPDAGSDGDEDAGAGDDAGTSRIPPGAQLAIRLDMERIRASRLAPQVQSLLESIPHWRLILEGSGIDPTTDLDRLMLATPNPRQLSRLVMAGRHSHPDEGRAFIDRVVARMAQARGVRVRWRREQGVDVANWANVDATERLVAVVGPRHFTISRPEDLVRVLGIAQARSAREAEDDDEETTPSGEGADSLLSMAEGEAFTLEAEGLENYVRNAPADILPYLPERVRFGVTDTGQGVSVRGVAPFPSEAAAASAAEFWSEELERQVAGLNFLVRAMVPRVSIDADGDEVRITTNASYQTAVAGIGFGAGLIGAGRRPATSSMGASSMGAASMGASSMGTSSMGTSMASGSMDPSAPSESEAEGTSMTDTSMDETE